MLYIVQDFYSFKQSLLQLCIWDFSGQTTQFFVNEKVDLSDGFSGKPGEEVRLVY